MEDLRFLLFFLRLQTSRLSSTPLAKRLSQAINEVQGLIINHFASPGEADV